MHYSFQLGHPTVGYMAARRTTTCGRVPPTNSRPRTVAVHHIAAIRNQVAVRSLWVEQVRTPYRLRHRRVNSLGDRAGYRIQQRPLELADCVRFMACVSANDRSGVLMRTLLSS